MTGNIFKRAVTVLLALALMVGMSACADNGGTAGSSKESAEAPASESVTEAAQNENEADEVQGSDSPEQSGAEKVLVVYFSATGTTKDIAEKIASVEGADIYEIKAAQEYTEEDLNWHDNKSRTTVEQNDPSARPEIGSEPLTLDGYATIYIGYPIWWGEKPRIMDTFVESYDFSGITMIPFCTSGSSGIGRSGTNLAENAGSGNWLEGRRFGAGASESEIGSWIEGLQ